MTVRSSFDLRAALGAPTHGAHDVRDAQVALAELRALRADADLVQPEALARLEPFVEAYRAPTTNGDALRLPATARTTEARINHALASFLAQPAASFTDPNAACADAALRSVLDAIHQARGAIRTPGQARA